MFEFTPKLVIWLWLICTSVAILGCLYALIAARLLARFAQKNATRNSRKRAVSILKPLYDIEPELEANLISFCRQDYGGQIQLIFGLQKENRPIAELIERLRKSFPDRDIRLSVNAARHGTNPKISNLINMLSGATHGILVISDSDIRVGPDYLENVIAAIEKPGVGAASCLYCGVASGGIWAQLAAEGINSHFLPNALVGLAAGLAKPCFGATIALSKDTLARIGGFEAFSDQLADDYALGAAVRRLGLGVEIPRLIVTHVCCDESFSELFRHEVRAARTIRSIDPLGYAGLALTNPMPFALAAAVCAGFTLPSLFVLLLSLASRAIVSRQAGRLGGARSGAILLSPLRDLLSLAVYAAGFLPGTLTWRGQRYGLRSDGTLTPS
ncbi:bacteriohopanetetrol glucosamine biosynthesis glycosyltransferase HpnI [Methyloceanibacter sp.]|uniref:bacteriohopanetetrol glucosamine biosynthesis glycosyltransferase HpnI n=1 Tax=Methyloceanibacter sp. TaxID=1965321 RepID=UPI002D2B46A2|nr:bacteriohopanetetrol glucosamine biosynthesis glycosyltransferase HpnI [Methyloceanibacter sp.]HZP09860.1 bacteriohopanetetrol glucosamine biosynthesis glycosyltransferase HpnI [Methyloceanibacter sp.]